jgi:hypothetical protein
LRVTCCVFRVDQYLFFNAQQTLIQNWIGS